jgi:hypothetical protein
MVVCKCRKVSARILIFFFFVSDNFCAGPLAGGLDRIGFVIRNPTRSVPCCRDRCFQFSLLYLNFVAQFEETRKIMKKEKINEGIIWFSISNLSLKFISSILYIVVYQLKFGSCKPIMSMCMCV